MAKTRIYKGKTFTRAKDWWWTRAEALKVAAAKRKKGYAVSVVCEQSRYWLYARKK